MKKTLLKPSSLRYSSKEMSKLLDEILNVRDKPEIHYTSRGVGYVHPFDIINSNSGKRILDLYRASSEKHHKLQTG